MYISNPVKSVEKPAITTVRSSDSMWILWFNLASCRRVWPYELLDESRRGRRGSSTEPLGEDTLDPGSSFGALVSMDIPSISLRVSMASSIGHSVCCPSSWRYVKLMEEFFRLRRLEKETTLDGMLSEIGPSKTCSMLVNFHYPNWAFMSSGVGANLVAGHLHIWNDTVANLC